MRATLVWSAESFSSIGSAPCSRNLPLYLSLLAYPGKKEHSTYKYVCRLVRRVNATLNKPLGTFLYPGQGGLLHYVAVGISIANHPPSFRMLEESQLD